MITNKQDIIQKFIFFWREKEDKKSSVLMDINLDGKFPIEWRSNLLILEVDFLNPLDNWYMGEQESYIIYDIEDYIEEKFEWKKIINVWSLNWNWKMKLYFYFWDEEIKFEEILETVFKGFSDYEYNFEIKEDKNWEIYKKYLMPDKYEYQTVKTRSVVNNLYEMWDLPEEERQIDHFIIFDKKEYSEDFLKEVEKENYLLVNKWQRDNKEFFVEINRDDNLLEEEIHDKISYLLKISEKHNWCYDWFWTVPVFPEVDEKAFNYLWDRRAKFYSQKPLEELKKLVINEDNYAISALINNWDEWYYENMSFEELVSIIEPIAEKWNVIAEYKLGYQYSVNWDLEKAIYWSEKWAEHLHQTWMNNLLNFVKKAWKYNKEFIEKSFILTKKHADLWYHLSESNLIWHYIDLNPEKNINDIPDIWDYLKSNSKKWWWAYHNNANKLNHDLKRYEEAIILYEKAIDQYKEMWVNHNPYTWSLVALADIYEEDWFLDYDKSFYYRKKASDLGDIDAMYGLSIMYKRWEWCKKDENKYKELLEKIINNEYDRKRWFTQQIIDDSIYNLAVAYKYWQWCEIDKKKSIEFLNKIIYNEDLSSQKSIDEAIDVRSEIEIELEDEEIEGNFDEMRENLEKAKSGNWIFKLIKFFKWWK